MTMKVGTPVRVKAPAPIEGTIKKIAAVDEGTRVEYVVAYSADGEQHERHFSEDELEAK